MVEELRHAWIIAHKTLIVNSKMKEYLQIFLQFCKKKIPRAVPGDKHIWNLHIQIACKDF